MTEPARPFRHLCPEADLRDSMTADEFWAHIFPDQGEDDPPEIEVESIQATPCPLCGQPGACAYDDAGLPLIHALSEQDDAP